MGDCDTRWFLYIFWIRQGQKQPQCKDVPVPCSDTDEFYVFYIVGGWYGIHNELMDFMKDKFTIVILSNNDDGGKVGTSMVAEK